MIANRTIKIRFNRHFNKVVDSSGWRFECGEHARFPLGGNRLNRHSLTLKRITAH